jgi:glycosyltransferase involved in cell wall biosynthesis
VSAFVNEVTTPGTNGQQSDRSQSYPPVAVSVLICTLNEAENLPHVIPGIPEWVYEILLVDGNSTDNTLAVATRLKSDIRILRQPGRGKGDALRHGLAQAQGDIVVTLDADGATDPAELDKFIQPLLNGYDFVKGTRFGLGFPRNKPWYRILGNWIITLTFDTLFLARYTDLCSGYNAFWKKRVLEAGCLPDGDGFENEPLINSRVRKQHLKVVEVAHRDSGRISGSVKEHAWRQGFKAIKCIVRERFRA